MARVALTTERLAQVEAELADEVGFDQMTVLAPARRFDAKVAHPYSHLENSQDFRAPRSLCSPRRNSPTGAPPPWPGGPARTP